MKKQCIYRSKYVEIVVVCVVASPVCVFYTVSWGECVSFFNKKEGNNRRIVNLDNFVRVFYHSGCFVLINRMMFVIMLEKHYLCIA